MSSFLRARIPGLGLGVLEMSALFRVPGCQDSTQGLESFGRLNYVESFCQWSDLDLVTER